MSVMTLEGVIDNGQIKLNTDVLLPEKAKVYVVIPGAELDPEAPVYDISLTEPDQDGGERIARIYSPRLVNPEDAKDFELEIIEEVTDAEL